MSFDLTEDVRNLKPGEEVRYTVDRELTADEEGNNDIIIIKVWSAHYKKGPGIPTGASLFSATMYPCALFPSIPATIKSAMQSSTKIRINVPDIPILHPILLKPVRKTNMKHG